MLISQAWAQAGGAGSSDFLVQLFPLVLIFVVFYFLLIRPQQAKAKAQREMLGGVKRGDRVVTGGGIIGLVTKVISDNELQVELAEGVRVRVLKQTITDIITRGESVRGGKESDDDDKPLLPVPAAGTGERKSLLGSLFGGGKKSP
jgi:preprotein translocase subunit YajC